MLVVVRCVAQRREALSTGVAAAVIFLDRVLGGEVGLLTALRC